MTTLPYQPISCDFHSELELLALRRTTVEIRYRNGEGVETIEHAPLLDLYTRNREEFLLLPNNREIRLDQLISVNGLELANYAC
ncbi:MAG: Rho-binding antiterminator [Saprospiraceae bacterium]